MCLSLFDLWVNEQDQICCDIDERNGQIFVSYWDSVLAWPNETTSLLIPTIKYIQPSVYRKRFLISTSANSLSPLWLLWHFQLLIGQHVITASEQRNNKQRNSLSDFGHGTSEVNSIRPCSICGNRFNNISYLFEHIKLTQSKALGRYSAMNFGQCIPLSDWQMSTQRGLQMFSQTGKQRCQQCGVSVIFP